ncbi:DUF2851 family protein [Catalinimonas sp. 4WD22]|uniref:DUF2851 family protein n=1 Tax=Catalinimonas locisalis TaxID=3133978 RepID=UPI0031011A89
MKEDLLQYIWQFQLFDKKNLRTTEGEPLNIIRPGIINDNSGPDFHQAQVKIGELLWFGSVEIHLSSKDWKYHHHHEDNSYENVILHVVWEGKSEITHNDGSKIPMLLLQPLVSPLLIQKYQTLLSANQNAELACAQQLSQVSDLVRLSVLQRSALQRVERKAKEILQSWASNDKDWNQMALQMTCQAFGFKVNAEAFATLGSKAKYQHIRKESYSFENLLAYMLAVSGITVNYALPADIRKNTDYLFNKYQIQKFGMNGIEFRKSRLRPANFPEVRMIQLSALLFQKINLLDLLVYENQLEVIWKVFQEANLKLSSLNWKFSKFPTLGKSSIESIIINAIVPFRYAFGLHHSDEKHQEFSIQLLELISSESNKTTKLFLKQGFKINSALESQGVLEQYHYYCKLKKCLSCSVGCAVMKNHGLIVT